MLFRSRSAHVIHVIDRSDSVPDALLRAAEVGVRATTKRADTPTPGREPARVDVVLVDRDAERMASVAGTVTRTDGGGDTHLAAGLNRALGLVDGQHVAHVVVWSDGMETRGDALDLTPALRMAGVRVDVPRLPPMPTMPEFLVDRLQVQIGRAHV